MSLIATFSVYPFIYTADGGTRLSYALYLNGNGKLPYMYLTPLQSLFMAFAYKVTNNIALYTFIQSFSIFLSISLLIKLMFRKIESKMLRYMWVVIATLIMLFPVTYVFSVIYTDSSGVIVGLCLSLYLINTQYINKIYSNILYFIGLMISFIVLFGFRANSLILLPLFIIIILIQNKNKIRKYLDISALLFSVIFVLIILPITLKLPKVHAESMCLAWEVIGTAKQDKTIANNLSPIGDVNEAINRYNPSYLNPIFWDDNPPLSAKKIMSSKYSGLIRKVYINMIFKHTKLFLNEKIDNISLVLGIKEPLLDITRGIHYFDVNVQHFGAVDTKINKNMRDNFFLNVNRYSFITMRPYILILISIFLLVVLWILRIPNVKLLFDIELFGITYYSGFFLFSQAMEFRYYAPTFFILFCVSITSMVLIIDVIIRNIEAKGIKITWKSIRRSLP